MRKLIVSSVIACTLAGGALAATTNIDALANFIASVTLGNEVDIDFSNVAYSAIPTVPGDNVELGTDNSIAYNGVFSAGILASAHAGEVEITAGNVGSTVDVECDSSAILGDGGGETINVIDIEVTEAPTVFGAANACDGIGNIAMSFVLAGGGADVLYFGGKIDGSTASGGFPGGGVFSTATGGDDVRVDVNYQ